MLTKTLCYFGLALLALANSLGDTKPRSSAKGPEGPSGTLDRTPSAPEGSVPGPDIIVGDLPSLEQFGASGSQVGLAVGTTSCNNGNVEVNWFELPNTDHSVIPQNLYRMSGGPNNSERFEQIGQSWLKHAFFALQENACGFGCIPAQNGTHLGVGCSDPYEASLNAAQDFLGSRAWVNPFTGAFPSTSASHTGHAHTGTSHRIIVEANDLNPAMNPGATYFAEAQYVTPHEYAWCQTHPGECNMYNNASYRQFGVSGTTSFTFAPIGSTVRMTPAINAWPGATIQTIEPEPAVDGRAFLAYKVTNSGGIWHYEYAIYNQNLDRGIQSFTIPLPTPLPFSAEARKRDARRQSSSGTDAYFDPGFHAPPQQPGFSADGTEGGAGFSNAGWTFSEHSLVLNWKSETLAENPNANAIRWGTLYNFYFDSVSPPQAGTATIGFFKTGSPVSVAIEVPAPSGGPTPTPFPTPTPSATPTPTGTPSPTPIDRTRFLNLSTRLRVEAGSNVAIGGFIILGVAPRRVLLRGIGPSLGDGGIPNPLVDPRLELHGAGGGLVTSNNNWRENQEAEIIATGIAPSNDLESAIVATLDPGAYTAILSGNNNGTGVGLVEIYDLSEEKTSNLGNISTRGFVGTGSNVIIAGFILGGGSGDNTILLRGIGPSLTDFGVPDALVNPNLDVRDENGELVAANDDWQNGPPVSLPPVDPLESAIETTLSPGAYTALLSGVNNGTGVGLVEVYDRGSP